MRYLTLFLLFFALPMLAQDKPPIFSAGSYHYPTADLQLDVNSEELIAVGHETETVYWIWVKGEKVMKLTPSGEILWVSDRVKEFVQKKPCVVGDSGSRIITIPTDSLPVTSPLNLLTPNNNGRAVVEGEPKR